MMNPTLQCFAQSLMQVMPAMGETISKRSIVIAGLIGMAIGSPYAALAQEADTSHAPEVTRSSQPMSEQASRNIGRVIGGLAGVAAGTVTGASNGTKALLAIGGAIIGDQAAQVRSKPTWMENDEAQGNKVKVEPDLLAVLKREPPPKDPRSAGRPISVEQAQGMRRLVIDAAAFRLIAQESWARASEAAVAASFNPRDAQVLEDSKAVAATFKEAMRRNNEAFYWFRNAAGVLASTGVDISAYLKVNQLFSQNVDHKGLLSLDHPDIRARVMQITTSGLNASLANHQKVGHRNLELDSGQTLRAEIQR